jgi:hypothetical protein
LAIRCDALDRIKQDDLPAIWVYFVSKSASHLSFSTEWLGHQCDAGLIELPEYAGLLGVRLGLENRDHYCEVPLPDELDDLLDLGYDEVLVYCHDVVHAQKLEHLSLLLT